MLRERPIPRVEPQPVVTVDPSHPHWPDALRVDPDPPERLDARGSTAVLRQGPVVAIVGTRRCTRYGLDVARELGRGLADAGVVVASGLARGIDAAAHEGALAGRCPPLGVVGTGLDHPYPRANVALWARVARAGVIVSEMPPDTGPSPWVFPRRNRILAALCDVLVVVESHANGGSLITAKQAEIRSRTIMAVPGSVRSSASAGANALIADGCAPVLDTKDVLVAVGLATEGRRVDTPGDLVTDVSASSAAQALSPGARRVLEAVGWENATFDQLALRTGLDLLALAAALDELERGRLLHADNGWYGRIGGRP